MSAVLCPTCSHQRNIPGNCHVRCNARCSDGMLKSHPLLNIFAALSPAGFGWANFNPYYPDPITECEHYLPAKQVGQNKEAQQ